MKQHLINKEVAEDSDGYSIYANPNKELKQEIIDFVANYAPTEVTIGWPPKKWEIIEKDGADYKLQSGRDTKYVSVIEVEEAKADGLKAAVNETFITGKYFHECFGTLYYYKECDTSPSLHIINITDVVDITDTTKFPNSMMAGTKFTNNDLNCYQSDVEYKMETYNEITMKVRPGVCGMFFSFTNDGDFRNRNYNKNLNYFNNTVIDPQIMLENFKNMIRTSIGNKLVVKGLKGNNYFTDNMLYIPYFVDDRGDYKFGVEMIKSRADGISYQECSGYTIYKKPSKTVDVTVDELINHIMSLIPVEVMNFFNLEFVLNYKYDFN